MNKEFVTYEQALALKELGFGEECFAVYYDTKEFTLYSEAWVKFNSEFNGKRVISAPLYQQAFRWFREKHKLYSPITDNGLGQYDFRVKHEWCGRVYDTYEEAESACLDKLLEIAKNK